MAYQPITNLAGSMAAQGGMPVTGSVSISNPSMPVTGTFWQATQPVSIASTVSVSVQNASLAVTGPLTDAQLRATALPVSLASTTVTGNVAITAASLPLPAGAATETTLSALNGKTPALGQALMAASQPVAIASNQSAIPVTGTFWQTTQPVSGTVTVGNASLAVTGPLTNTELRAAAVPVSLTSTTVTGSVAVTGPLTDTQLRAAAVPVSPPTIAKGTQGASGYTTQALKDAGRVSFAASTVVAGVTTVTAEALLSMVPVRDGVAAAAATSFAVTGGKRLRIQKILVSGLTTAAAVLSARVALRMSTTGAITATSPIVAVGGLNGPAAVALTGDHLEIIIPDGFEISGTQQIGLTHVAAAATGTIRASIIGFEY